MDIKTSMNVYKVTLVMERREPGSQDWYEADAAPVDRFVVASCLVAVMDAGPRLNVECLRQSDDAEFFRWSVQSIQILYTGAIVVAVEGGAR